MANCRILKLACCLWFVSTGCLAVVNVNSSVQVVRQEKCRGLFVHTGRTGFISFKYFSDYPEILLISGSSLLLLLSGESVEHVLRPLKKR